MRWWTIPAALAVVVVLGLAALGLLLVAAVYGDTVDRWAARVWRSLTR